MTLVLVHLTDRPLSIHSFPLFPARTSVTFEIFTFGVACGISALLALGARAGETSSRAYSMGRLSLQWLIVVSIALLPYLRGTYAIVRRHPVLRPLGADAVYLATLRPCGSWHLVDMGPSSTVLSCPGQPGVVIIPTEKLKTFEIRTDEETK